MEKFGKGIKGEVYVRFGGTLVWYVGMGVDSVVDRDISGEVGSGEVESGEYGGVELEVGGDVDYKNNNSVSKDVKYEVDMEVDDSVG